MWMDSRILNLGWDHWPEKQTKNPYGRWLSDFFPTQKEVVVLSSSNQAARETHLETCLSQGVPILQRKGGGGTVVLGPGCVVWTFAFLARDVFGNGRYFEILNGVWMDALRTLGIEGLHQNGISDICVGDRKIVGTSVFRRKHLLVYQGSLLVNPDFGRMAALLSHPSREPSYRQGRTHRDFLTSLKELGYHGSCDDVCGVCHDFVESHVGERLAEEFQDPSVLPVLVAPWNAQRSGATKP